MSHNLDYAESVAAIKAYGFKLVSWDSFVAASDRPPGLLERAQGVRGIGPQAVVYDPSDDCDGWLLVGERETITRLTVNMILEQEPEDGPLSKLI